MNKYNPACKRDAFELLFTYKAYDALVLLNYPFKQEWIFSYLIRNRNLDVSHEIGCLNLNENLQVNWKEMYEAEPKFINYSLISYNKVACESLNKVGVKINYYGSRWISDERLLEYIQKNKSFGIKELKGLLEKEKASYLFESKEIWDYCFKNWVDEEMINAWTYYDILCKEVEMKYQDQKNIEEYKLMERYHEQQEIAQGEYESRSEDQDENISEAFENDPDNLWNVD